MAGRRAGGQAVREAARRGEGKGETAALALSRAKLVTYVFSRFLRELKRLSGVVSTSILSSIGQNFRKVVRQSYAD